MKPRVDPPPRALPLAYFGIAYACLAVALLVPATNPRSIAGFFFHPKMFFVVHLITLGWVTCSIFGATYIVGPIALRMPVPARKLDWWIFGGLVAGAAGVIAHFWINEYSGVAWSGGMLVVVFILMAVRVLKSLKQSGSPPAVRVHIALAYINLLFAAALGTLLAVNRVTTILPGSHLADVFGHVHLAAVGWATLMVIGVAYRLIPMFLPAAPPKGPLVWASALLPEAGVLGMAWSFLYKKEWAPWFALLIALGLLVFIANVARMLRDPRPPPVKLKRPDVGMFVTLQSILYLLACTGIGLFLGFSEEWHMGWIMAYGVFGLLGFLAQIVLGIGMRLLPMFAWIEAWAESGYTELPASPYEMPARPLLWGVLATWTPGVPLLAWALANDRLQMISAAAWILFAGLMISLLNTILVVRHAFPRGPR